ncbi:MAG TPA: MBL fold metallo-hydrolase [Spirochaetota bacterium]|nr:MBL fold metallo-hydrolase [Spirochaetota bacterium]
MKRKLIIILAGVLMITSLVYGINDEDDNGFSEEKWRESVQAVDRSQFHALHVDGGKYFNPWMVMEMKGFAEIMKWRFFADKQAYSELEESALPAVKPLTAEFINTHDNFMSWIGHASVIIKSAGSVILVDPVFGDIPFVKKRRTQSAITYNDASRITGSVTVLLTHNHYDHLDSKSMESIPAGAKFIVPAGLRKTVEKLGASDIAEMDWWEELRVDGIKIIFLPSQHWSKRGMFDMNKSLWGSFLVDTGKKRIFVCGDSGYSLLYREIAAKYPAIDYAFMSLGAFHPRWFMHYSHQDADEAVRGFRDLNAKVMVPFHWGAFRLGDEPEGYPAIHVKLKFPEARITDCGEVIKI